MTWDDTNVCKSNKARPNDVRFKTEYFQTLAVFSRPYLCKSSYKTMGNCKSYFFYLKKKTGL